MRSLYKKAPQTNLGALLKHFSEDGMDEAKKWFHEAAAAGSPAAMNAIGLLAHTEKARLDQNLESIEVEQ
jgi:hypothetical protein